MKLTSLSRTFDNIYRLPLFGDYIPSLGYFIVGMNYQISKELYKMANLNTKIALAIRLANFGNSSIVLYHTLEDASSGKILASMFRTLVRVNMDTRRPATLVLEERRRCEEILSRSEKLAAPRLLLPSVDKAKCFSCELVARNIELDFYYHVNYSMYLEYSTECAAQAAASGYYSKLKGDICTFCVKKASTSHLSETRSGEKLTVITWEEPTDPYVLYFIVLNKDKEIFHAMLEYYQPVEFSNL